MKYADGVSAAPSALSILGVFRDGTISQDAWPSFAPEIRRALHGSACEAGYGETLRATQPDVFSAITEDSRTHGLNDELLRTIAPAAQGDAILVIEVYGRPAADGADDEASGHLMVAQHAGHGSHGSGASGASDFRPSLAAKTPAFEISASIYSVALRRGAVFLNMEYRGPSRDEAIRIFVRNLAATAPHSRCSGWDWTAVTAVSEQDDAGLARRLRLVPAERME